MSVPSVPINFATQTAEKPAEVQADPVSAARETILAARAKAVEECVADIKASLDRHGCRLSTRQEWVDGTPAGPAQVIVVPRE